MFYANIETTSVVLLLSMRPAIPTFGTSLLFIPIIAWYTKKTLMTSNIVYNVTSSFRNPMEFASLMIGVVSRTLCVTVLKAVVTPGRGS